MTTKKTSAYFDYHSITSFDDACKKEGIDPQAISDHSMILEEFRVPLIKAYRLYVIFKAINNGWVPDWSNTSQGKYFPYFRVLSSGFGFSGSVYYYGGEYSTVGSRLCTYSAKVAIYIADTFKSEYEGLFLIQK